VQGLSGAARWRQQPAGQLAWCWLGEVPYAEATCLQERLRDARLLRGSSDLLLFLEHPPTYTLGRRAKPDDLPLPPDHYQRLGISIYETNRGGRITYHGPGQLVGYGIFAVRDIVAYVRALEQALIVVLGRWGIFARNRPQDGPTYTGVWVGERKIASIGVHVRQGVTIHGFALNVDVDLEPFRWIVPCGIPDVEMTSVQRELEEPLDPQLRLDLAQAIAQELSQGAPLLKVEPNELPVPLPVGVGR
jgi:lipoyl(octanoyl) transferase